MRNFVYRLLAVGCLVLGGGILPASAQQAQDALYIFRNDGRFNAFFFDDIERFEYSKIDTLGVEHEDYVVQEVYALDTIFRIPISAIDSVAFVTPETVYKKDVIKANPLISDYVVASDSASWIRLSASVPTSMLPKKGDKWLIEENKSPLLPGGFGGRVTSVESGGGGYTITTEPLQPEEAFERAMLKMAVGTQNQANARRSTRSLLWGSEEPIELEPMGAEVGLTGSKDLINDFDIYSMSATPLGSIKYYIEPTLHARSFLSVDPLAGVHIDGYIGADAYIEYGGKISGTLASRLDLPFPHKLTWFRKSIGEGTPIYAKALWKVGIFVEGSGNLEMESIYTGTYHAMAEAGYHKPVGFNIGEWSGDTDMSVDPKTYELKKLTVGGAFTGGVMLEAGLECFNPLISGISGVGLRLEAGRILEFKIPVTDISEDLPLTYYTDHTYDVLDIDDIVSYGPFVFGNPYISMYGWQSNKFQRRKFLTIEAGVVPQISEMKIKGSGRNDYMYGETTCSYDMSRNLLLPVKVGFTVLDWKDDVYATYWRPDTYWNFFSGKEVEFSFFPDPLADVETSYTVHPTVQIPGSPPILCDEFEMKVEPAYFDIYDYKEIELPEEEGTLNWNELWVGTNMPKVEMSTGVDWATASWMPINRVFVMHYKALPPGVEGRDFKLHIVGKNSKGEVLLVKDVPVRQGRIVVQFSPEVIEAEAAGGTYTAKIVKSPLTGHQVKPGDSFLTPTISGDVVTVEVDPNPDPEEREGTVIVSGVTVGGKYGEGTLKVHQKASEQPFTLNPESLEVAGYDGSFQGGELKRQITVTYPVSAKSLTMKSSDESWLTVDDGGGIGIGTNICTVTVKPNTSLKNGREAKITAELTKADGTTETKTLTVKQSAMKLDVQLVPDEVTLMAEASEGSEYSDKKTILVKITPWDDIVAATIKSQQVKPAIEWIKASIEGNIITVYGEANPVNEERTNYVTYTLTPVSGDPIVLTLTVTQSTPVPTVEFCDDYAPKPIFLAAEAGSQASVTFNCPNVDHISNIHCLNDSWLGGSASGMVVLLTATKDNTTGAARTGQFELTFLMKDGTTVKRIYSVTQDVDSSVPHVMPTALTYPAKGGTQTVQAYVGSKFNRTGFAISSDGEDWVSAVNYSDYHLEITVKPNTTDAERTCTVTVYMAKFEGDNPAPGTKTEAFPITITQAAGGISVNACTLSATAMMQEQTTGATSTNTYGESFASPNISVTLKGTSLHVVATNNYKKDYDVYQNVLEFDITSVGGNFANCKVENLEFRHIYNDTYVDWTSPGVYGKGDDVTLQLTNLRWQESKSNYTPGAKSTFVFSGTVAEGVKFGKLTQTKVNYSEDKPKQVFNYVENQGNSATLTVELTIDPSALNY
ncbi:MAG: hypothetical protein IKQ58_03315 [Prevotella sp.]|nr:hypothetical protein [Prevotella sp.]